MDEFKDLKKGIMVIQQLKESTGNINKKCDQILTIMSNPVLFLLSGNEIDKLVNGLIFDIAILNNFINAFNKTNDSEDKK